MHKTEGSRATNFFYEGSAGEIDRRTLGVLLVDRMVVKQRVAHFEPIKRLQTDRFITLFQMNRLLDLDEFLELVLLFNTRRLNQEDKGAGTAVHNRHFRRAHVDKSVIDPKTGQRRHQVLYGGDAHVVLHQTSGERSVPHIGRCSRDLNHWIQVNAGENDASIGGSRAQGEIDFLPCMQTHAGGADHIFECSLF